DLLAKNSYMTDDVGRKLTPQGVMLADEEGSSDATNGYANLRDTQVYENVIASCKVAIRDYAEGSNAQAHHGLKNTLIANNTIILPQYMSPDYNAGIQIQDNHGNDTGSAVVNNVVYGFGVGRIVLLDKGPGMTGVAFDNNVYFTSKSPQAAFGLAG